ncbi:MAG: Zn-ribbon domain-containing OB-fold protein [Myxococcota bacterium]
MAQTPGAEEVLRGPHVLEYPYRRSLGPVLGRFFNDLRDGKLTGIRTKSCGVLVPPQEYDPMTGETLDEFVEVGPGGEVVSWSWVAEPRKKQPLQHPFAFALIKLDGADAPLLHAVDAGEESKLAKGTRVVARFAAEPAGGIRDIECFDLEAS